MLNGFAIVKVCYNDCTIKDSIKCVKATRFSSKDGKSIDIMGNIVSWSKDQIIDMITDKSMETRVFTATIDDDKYLLGHEVEALSCNGQKFIRTKISSSMRDDLDDLPEYQAHV